jgi:hypothetical protein
MPYEHILVCEGLFFRQLIYSLLVYWLSPLSQFGVFSGMWSVSDSHYTALVFETWWIGEGSFVSTDLAYLYALFVLLTSDQCLTQLPWNQLPLLVNLKKIKLALLYLSLVLGIVPTPDSVCSDRLVRFFRIGDSDLHLFLELLYTHLFLKFERHLECLYGMNSNLKHPCKDTLILPVYKWPWPHHIGKEINCCSVENCWFLNTEQQLTPAYRWSRFRQKWHFASLSVMHVPLFSWR